MGSEMCIRDRYVSSDRGSTANDLTKAASDFGLHGTVLQRLDAEFLRASGEPILLRLDLSRHGEGTFHWVAFLGDNNGRALVLDAPRPAAPTSYADLLGLWTGHGIVLSREPISHQSLIARRLASLVDFWPLLLGVLFGPLAAKSVSYTHLTLPTICSV